MRTVKVTSKDFGYTTKFLKKNGYEFNASAKTWSGSKDISFLVDEKYVTIVGVQSPFTFDCMSQKLEG